MHYKKRGDIAVFLALLISVILAFILVLIRDIRTQVIRGIITISSDVAIKSCFAEYNRRLFDEYGLLYVDPTYKSEMGDAEQIREHFAMYMNENMHSDMAAFDISDIQIKSIEILDVATAFDKDKEYLKNQISNYVYGRRGDYAYGYSDREVYMDYLQLVTDDYELYMDNYIKMSDTMLLDEIINRINMDMINNESIAFDLSNCIYEIELKVTVIDGSGREYNINKKYDYAA